MSLDPTFSPYALAVSLGSGLAAAGAHATALAGSGQPWPPRRVLVANLVSTALVGMSVSWLLQAAPWWRIDPLGILLASMITGHVLGPRGVRWLFGGLLKAAQSTPVVGKFVPDAPGDDPPAPAPPVGPPPEPAPPPAPQEVPPDV